MNPLCVFFIIVFGFIGSSCYRFCIVPGMGGSKIYNSKNKTIWPPSNPLQIKELDLQFENKQLIIPDAYKVGDIDKIKIDNTASYLLTKNVYYSGMIRYLQKDNHELFALPYDFRYSVYPKYYQSLYQQYLDFFNEEFTKSKEPFIVVCHSLGGLVFHHFLTTFVDKEWIKKHVHKIYFINVPFGGTPISFFTIMDNAPKNNLLGVSGTPIISHLTGRIKNLYLFGGFYQTWPLDSTSFYKNKDWILPENMQDYLEKFPRVLENYQLFKKFHLPHRKTPLCIPTHVIYCTGKNTTTSLDVDNNINGKVDGDGLIPTSSLLALKDYWRDTKYTEIKGQEHSGVNNYNPLLEMISKNS